jgi:hypothetical protein
LLHPAPEDLGPLAPGEEEGLLAFAQEHMPRFYDAMQRLRQRDPDRFRARLEENAPRLRRLRRIYENNPRLAEIIQTHAENMFTIHRKLRQLRPAASDPAQYEATLQAVRALIAENVRLEAEALKLLAAELEARREQRIAEHVARLLDTRNDLADEPEGLRELALAARSADQGPQGEDASARLRQAVTERVGGEIEALRQRSAQMRENAGEEVDSRLKALLSPPGPGEDRPTGPHPGRGC